MDAYTVTTLAYYMLTVLGTHATTFDISLAQLMGEPVNQVLLLYGVDDISDATDFLKLRAFAKVEAYNYLLSIVSTYVDYSDGELSIKASQLRTGIIDLLNLYTKEAEQYGLGSNDVVITKMVNENNPYLNIDIEDI